MRKGMWGAIAGVAAGAGGAWGQTPVADPPPPAAVAPAGEVLPVQGFGPVPPGAMPPGLPPGFQPGLPGGVPPGFGAAPGHPALPPAIMPPIAPGPAGDPQGFGPMAGFGPPPGPMYPPPGPYGAPLWQPAPNGHGAGGDLGYNTAPHFWMSYEYLMWYARSQAFPFPLVTSSAPTDQGLLNRPSTLVLVGGGNIQSNPLSGARVTAGFWGDCDRRYGFEASGFVTEYRADVVDLRTSPSGIPLLARPFRDSATPKAISTLVVGSPTVGQARVIVENGLQAYSVEANGLVNLYRSAPDCGNSCTLDALAGYRYFELNELFRESSGTRLGLPSVTTPITTVGPFGQVTVVGQTVTPGVTAVGGLTVPSGSTIVIVDEIRTRNQFNGVQSGFRTEMRRGMWSMGLTGKLAIGHMRQTLEVNGHTDILPTGGGTVFGRSYGGLYANAATIGRFNNDEFAVIPEVNLTLGMAVTRNLTLTLGYNFLYVDNVTRPGGNLVTTVNTGTVPFSGNYGATNRPLVRPVYFNQDDFYLQGLTTGFTIRF